MTETTDDMFARLEGNEAPAELQRDAKTARVTTKRDGAGYSYTITCGAYLVAEGWCKGSRGDAVEHARGEVERLGYQVRE